MRLAPCRFAIALSITAAAFAALAGTATGSYPPPVAHCGTILHQGKHIALDISEAHGEAKISCAVARGAMRQYLVRADSRRWPPGSDRNLDFRYATLPFSCYTSRPDRVGWDFHCFTDFRSDFARWVDVAAGRRGHLCRLRDTRRCPPG